MTFPETKHVSVSIQRPPAEVYAFAGDARQLPRWAAGLANSTAVRAGDEWVMESPMGKVKVRFAPANPFGVLDHDVTLPSGEVVHNPLRVVRNGDGSEVVFTLFHRPGMTDGEFAADVEAIRCDLMTLKTLLEGTVG